MEMCHRFMGWTGYQWACAAAFYGAPLPLVEGDAMRAGPVQDHWFAYRVDQPDKPTILLTNAIGQVFEQTQRSDHLVWAARLLYQARKQFYVGRL